MKKRLLSTLLILCMSISLLSGISFAASNGTCGENVTWTLDDAGILTISGTGKMYNYDNFGNSETPWYNYSSKIIGVNIEKGITSIGNHAFSETYNITKIIVPEGVTSIGDYAFCENGCSSNLKTVELPESVTSIGKGAFRWLSCFEMVNIPYGVAAIKSETFAGCKKLKSIELPESVTFIDERAFEECTGLTEIEIPSRVTSLGIRAFKACTSLRSVTIPESVTVIAPDAFISCSSLSDVYYTGSEEQWNEIIIGQNNECLTGAEIHFLSTPEVSVTEVSLDKAALALEVGETAALTASVSPADASDQSVVWNSSNENVATVKNGVVTAIGVGNAAITVTTNDGGYTAVCNVTVNEKQPEEPVEAAAVYTLADVSGRPGDTVKVALSLDSSETLNSIAVYDIQYDNSVLTFVGFSDYEEISELTMLPPSFDESKMAVTVALKEASAFQGDICVLNFKISESAEDGTTSVTASARTKFNADAIVSAVSSSQVTVRSQILGDINGDESVDVNDAVLLFQYSMLPELYPVEYVGDMDFTNDGVVDVNDAVLLFQYSMLPELYPIG